MYSSYYVIAATVLCLSTLCFCLEDEEDRSVGSPRFLDNSLAIAGAGVLAVSGEKIIHNDMGSLV